MSGDHYSNPGGWWWPGPRGDCWGRELDGSWMHLKSRTHRISWWIEYGVRGADKSQRIWLKDGLDEWVNGNAIWWPDDDDDNDGDVVLKWRVHLSSLKLKISAHRIGQETHMELSVGSWNSATCSMKKNWTSYLEFHEQGNVNDRRQ